MKKLSILNIFVALLITFSIPCNAQEEEKLQIGVKGGLNISNLYLNDEAASDMIFGYNAGVFVKKPFTAIIAIQPELYVSSKGSSITYNNVFVGGTAKFNLTYLEMPVLCVAKVSKHVNFQFGPYISYLLNSEIKNVVNNQLFDFEKNINVNDFNRIDAGIIAGFGIEVHTVTMGARYIYGLTKVGKEQTLLGLNYRIPNANNGIVNFYLSVSLN
jgi:hypothetical protein